jgi:hypothetical protein
MKLSTPGTDVFTRVRGIAEWKFLERRKRGIFTVRNG